MEPSHQASTGPLVSIVTPAYNQAAYIRETIESVLAQDYSAIEYRVIDDGSTDATPAILAEFNGQLHWESQANRGQTSTINKGWEASGGEILAWLNSDDTLLPGAVSKAVAFLKEHPDIGIVFGDTLFTDASGKPLHRSGPQHPFDYLVFVLECHNPIPQPSTFVRRSVLLDTGLLDPHYYYFMDWDFWLRAGLKHRISYFPEVLSTYRLHSGSKTVAQLARAAPELEYMYKKFFDRENLPPEIRRRQKPAMANMYFTSGNYYLTGNDPRGAARMSRFAFRNFPGLVFHPRQVHKLLYCLLGGASSYRFLRDNFRKIKGTRRY